jgi:hypothetical protein
VAASYDVVLHMDWPTWCAEMAVWEGLGDVDYPAARVCETADGAVVAPSTVLSAALAGHVRRIVFGADDEILSFGRSRRLFSGPQHRAGLAKYRGCTHPYGCDRTGPSLQMDHDHEWEDGGETDIDNGQPKCDHHNRWKTNHKAQQRRGPPT